MDLFNDLGSAVATIFALVGGAVVVALIVRLISLVVLARRARRQAANRARSDDALRARLRADGYSSTEADQALRDIESRGEDRRSIG